MNEFLIYFNNDGQLQEVRKMGVLSDYYHMDYGGGSLLLKTYLSKETVEKDSGAIVREVEDDGIVLMKSIE